MKYERLEVRLDEEHLLKVKDLAATYETTVSEAVRRAIDEAHDKAMLARRLLALERILASPGTDDVPEDMDTLKRQLGRHPDYLQDDVGDIP